MVLRASAAPAVDALEARAYRIPTDGGPESDGTLVWDATTLVVAEVRAGDATGLGWTYADASATGVVRDVLAPHVLGSDPAALRATWAAMVAAVRNVGRSGVASNAISAVDVALWDLRARLAGLALADLFGRMRDVVPAYGSGGFTSYDERRLSAQLGGWAADGFPAVKMKVGRDPSADPTRAGWARRAIGDGVELFVDANGAYRVAEALALAQRFAGLGVRWYEEPVDHRDLVATRRVRDRVPDGMEVALGEYGYDTADFEPMIAATDVLQADATRCGGYTGIIAVDGLCEARRVPLSTHCAPNLHAHVATSLVRLRNIEWFHDHVRIESMLFDGALVPQHGAIVPDRSRPGHGLTFKHADAERFAIP